jgi:[ribosomal protein S5]-alanine N-acetyltransferase
MPIAGASLVLEPLQARHAGELFPLLSDPELYAHFEHEPPGSEAQLAERYKRWEARRSPDGTQLWLNWLVRSSAAEPLGYVQATVLVGMGRAWIAYVIGRRHQGIGVGRNAVALMCEHLRSEYGIRHFMACVEASNTRSIRLLEALGLALATPEERAGHRLSPSERLYVRNS